MRRTTKAVSSPLAFPPPFSCQILGRNLWQRTRALRDCGKLEVLKKKRPWPRCRKHLRSLCRRDPCRRRHRHPPSIARCLRPVRSRPGCPRARCPARCRRARCPGLYRRVWRCRRRALRRPGCQARGVPRCRARCRRRCRRSCSRCTHTMQLLRSNKQLQLLSNKRLHSSKQWQWRSNKQLRSKWHRWQ